VLCNSVGRELFTNPAKAIAARISAHRVALAGDCAATLALARHGSSVLLRIANHVVAATGLADAVVALREPAEFDSGLGQAPSSVDALFHDDEIDGPSPQRLRVLALTLSDDRTVAAARVAGLDDVYLLAAQDVPDASDTVDDMAGSGGAAGSREPAGAGRPEQQLAVLAVRLEMAAVYLRLVRG
jgi:hypothetical protein